MHQVHQDAPGLRPIPVTPVQKYQPKSTVCKQDKIMVYQSHYYFSLYGGRYAFGTLIPTIVTLKLKNVGLHGCGYKPEV